MNNRLVGSLLVVVVGLMGLSCSSGSSGGGGGLTIASVAPDTGDVGVQVTITGTGFAADVPSMEVLFFDNVAAVITSATTTELVVTVPAGAVTGPITVTNVLTSLSATTSTDFTVTDGSLPVAGEVEPNDTFDEATVVALPLGQAGRGTLDTEADVDFWSMTLTAGDVISIELFGARLDHASWDADDSIPRITIYDTDGATVLVNHDYGSWFLGKHDLDHPRLLVPATGIYYASVTVDGAAVTDGDYCIRLNHVNVGTLQIETGDDVGDNDTHTNAEPVLPGTLYGFHVDNDSDYFSFTIASPSIVRFELFSFRNGIFAGDDEYFDPAFTLYDTDGTTPLLGVDDAYFYDPALDYFLDVPGTYFLEVKEAGFAGDAPYFLTYSRSNSAGASESEPNEDAASADAISYGASISGTVGAGQADWFTFQGTTGDMVRIQVFDAFNSQSKADLVVGTLYGPDGVTSLPTGPTLGLAFLQTATTILQETGPHFIVIEPDVGATAYRIELTRFRSATYESEPNDDFSQPDALGAGGRSAGMIGAPADVDTFEFTAAADRLTTISIYASSIATGSDGFSEFSGHGSILEPTLRILDSTGSPIAASPADWLTVSTESVTNGLPCGAVSFVAPAAGTFYVEVTDANGGSGPDFYYVIERTD